MLYFRATKEKPFKWVWRAESEDGRGPYRNGNPVLWQRTEHNCDNGHPTPQWDFTTQELNAIGYYEYVNTERFSGYRFKFGFTSIRQYEKWFSQSERRRMLKAGIKLRRKKAAKAVASRYQCIYIPYDPNDKSEA